MTFIRPPAVAGTFYPGDAGELQRSVRHYLDAAATPAATPSPKAIVVPHAGYVYSGALAAAAFARIDTDAITRVVLLGPCHRVALNGLALSSAASFHTPLGDIELDTQLAAQITGLPQMQVFDATHEQEHSLEVQLPFLQVLLDEFTLLPLVVGQAAPDAVAEVLDRVWGGPETLIVISTDLTHFLDYHSAQTVDAATCKAVENLDSESIGDDQACGRMPLKGLLTLAKNRGMAVETIGLCNSGDTAGTKDRVVGYGAWAFYEATP